MRQRPMPAATVTTTDASARATQWLWASATARRNASMSVPRAASQSATAPRTNPAPMRQELCLTGLKSKGNGQKAKISLLLEGDDGVAQLGNVRGFDHV